MGIRPDFTPDHVRDLKALGVCDEQISELRKTLLIVRNTLAKPAANGVTSQLLAEVESLASKLVQKLTSLCSEDDAEHNKACRLIEACYWQQRTDDSGHSAMLHLIPRLRALQAAARCGLDQIPAAQPVRSRTADPAPVERIHSALVYGWSLAHAGNSNHGWGARNEKSKLSAANLPKNAWQPQCYPKRFQPSTSPGCDFGTIVGICYDAAGSNAYPERAIREYVNKFREYGRAAAKRMMGLFARPPNKS